jgi:type IV pilus assembly protein PilY1
MNKKTLTLRLSVSLGFFFSKLAFSALLQSPIQVTAGAVPPNLMFTLDDSGSMDYECLPDSLCAGSRKVGTQLDSGYIATPDINVAFGSQMRSSQTNPLYYDPATLYLPWMKKDGTRYPSQKPAEARQMPESTSNTTVHNLVTTLSVSAPWCTGTSNANCTTSIKDIYLARYFVYTGGSVTNANSYTEVKIQSGNVYPKATSRTDCAGTTCTFEQESINFANWYSYHRTRMRVAIAGTSEAFYEVPESYRVGYGRINKATNSNIDGFTVSTIEKGVRPFTLGSTGTKSSFYDWITQRVPSGSTPLRRAMDDVGQYYSYTDQKGPWGETPGSNNSTPAVACRRSFHVMMTDGLWNGGPSDTAASAANVDGVAGPTISGINSQTYTYTPTTPFSDTQANTLADVAMYYWNRDLNPLVANAIRPTSNDPAFWQHMVNYTIGFGVNGILDVETALPGLQAGTTNWPKTSDNTTANVDDLWHAAINSRGRYLSARNTAEYAGALKKIIDDIASINGSESGVAVSSKAISASTVVRKYEPTFASEKWSGDVEAIRLTAKGANAGTAWRASEKFPAPAARKIFAYNAAAISGVKSLAFTWTAMTDAMKTKLYGATEGGENLVNYLRGERTNENVTYRVRANVLGDIVNSAPVLVKDQFDGQYDFLPAGTPAAPSVTAAAKASYRRFLGAKKLREAQLFIGANDGMLHAFSDSTGEESFAYVPDSILGKMKKLSDKDYEHDYYVDGPTVEGDIYDAGASKWRNVVFGGTGAGGKSLYAINVPVVPWAAGSNAPSAYTASQSAPGAADVLWEISPAKTGFEELGNVLSTPEHGVMRNGTWVVIVGNGVEGANKKAQLYIINALTGTLIKTIDTGVGSLSSPNGLGGVRVVRDAQKQIVAAYAGDLQGNMWKFDLSSSVASDWNVAFGDTATARNPLYKTAPVEPITAAPTFIVHPSGGVMVLFGSGKLFEVGDAADQSARALYGVWDKVPLGAASATASDRVTDNSTIVAQAFSNTAAGGTAGAYYGLIVTPVDYASKRGWRLPLTLASGQRLVDEPEISVGRVFMQTVSPAAAVASCSASSLVRHGLALDPFMNAISSPTFDTTGDNLIDTADNMFAVAVRLNSNGPASVVRKYGTSKSLLLGAGSGGLEFQGGSSSSKRYWRQIVNQP